MYFVFQSFFAVDRSVRCETPGGSAGQVRHLRAQGDEVAHRTPPGKRAPETEINNFNKQKSFPRNEIKKRYRTAPLFVTMNAYVFEFQAHSYLMLAGFPRSLGCTHASNWHAVSERGQNIYR
ncbi:hypothetical protein ABE65_002545 [Fictibacillus phosphorivorans]|uniref:Uncharacterized protein n=1 Tax=Fictibacillus phosphorivorans TaxID=1221500 RepID=A0A160IKK5_9BACL|nr:hypothetical protein ABE65_002545 [Fictibacillus phosphorivorans]